MNKMKIKVRESKKNEEIYDRPVTLYITTRYDDAEEAQKFLDSIGGGDVNVSKERNGDTLSVSIDGADDDISTFLAVYKDNYANLEKDCDADVMGWTDPVDLKYYTAQGRKELTGESHKKSEGLPFGKRFTDAAGHTIELSDWRIKEDDLGYFCGYDKGGKPIFDQDISKSVVFPFDQENYPNDEVSKEMDRLWKMGYTNTRKLQKATRVESKKSEDYKNFTLKQLRFQLKNGWAKDLTNASDEEIQAIIDSGHEISGVSNGTYGMNGLKVTYSNPDGSIGSGVVIGRTPNLFALLSPQKPKKTGDAPKPSESKKSEGVGGKIKMGIDYNMFMRMCASAAYLDDNEDYWDALWEYYSEMGEIEDACEFFDNLFQYTSWCDEDEVYDEYLDDSYKDGTKSKAECIEAAVDAGDLDVFKTDKGYLVIH